ncbi:TIGR01458 family HAD-type hydrolase [Shewanella sp. AS16]|uniref:TIGR01458 family HAD-type hydrolase n=1 Tax=Shewanella sp. AS16 TaxID=2907625 RepID=UPI001F435C19|nr:TIGR01458 family HAD-type hydrolase [Shewanella sp. AS16]MCE9687634.1 TIGR01458 family HAD-type hydrolase [Shewanella sp. AS16]
MFKAVFVDLSGVLYEGKRVLPGAVAAVNRLQQSPLTVRFVTNTSRMNRGQILHGLQEMGFSLESRQLFTAPDAVKALVEANNWRPYCVVHSNIEAEFSALDRQNPNVVIIGDAAEGFSYSSLDLAFQLCQAGAPLIGIGRNRYFKLDGSLHLDAGPFIYAIEYAASITALIVGKPSPEFFAQVIASTSAKASEILMIGDDIFGDIEGAIKAGMQGCLVKTGKYQRDDERLIGEPCHCVASIVEAVELALGGSSPKPVSHR